MDGFVTPKVKRPVTIVQPRKSPFFSSRTGELPQVPQRRVAPAVETPRVARNPLLNAAPPGSRVTGSRRQAAAAPPRAKRGSKVKKPLRKRFAFKAGIVVVLLLLGVGGFIGTKAITNLDRVFHGNVISDATAAFNSTPLKGESTGRVNILLAGDSSDDPGHQGAQLTDSILLLSVDTKNHSAFMLSIPRDLWVYIPGLSEWEKINSANSVTNFSQSGYPSGGMGQLSEIVQTDFNIPVDYYGLMDYGAFKDSVDAVGGVTITINSPDPRGLYDPNTNLKLPNGSVTLNGQEALNLARARGDGYGSYGFPDSDFDRTEHQRQLFEAVAEKAKTLGVLANPVKVSDLISTLGNNFQTNLSLQNVLRLIQISKGINLNSVQSYAFSSTLTGGSDPLLTTYTDPTSGEEALVPTAGIGNYGQIQQYYQQLTSNNPIAREAPSVVVLNGSDVDGLAAEQRSALQNKDFNVSAIATASTEYPGTMIVNNAGTSKPNSLKALQQLYPGSTVTSDTGSAEAEEAQGYTADFVVILGQNWDSTAASSSSSSNQ